MKPLPWSFTALSDFKNCPRAYHEKRVLKSVVEETTEAQTWGTYVHKAFEDRQAVGAPLPDDLNAHEEFMLLLESRPGTHFTEQKIGLDMTGQPCAFFTPWVWFRGVVDYLKVHEEHARLVDYKTGKQKTEFDQLDLFAIHTFAAHSSINIVNAQFYWTQTRSVTKKVYDRKDIPALWSKFIPDLKQYALAFKTDTWQPRQSGLCNGWCPVTTCEFYKPKRHK